VEHNYRSGDGLDYWRKSDGSGGVRIGDQVRLVGIPLDVHDDEKLQTRTLFEKCLGETFIVAGLETVEGLPFQLVQLDVGHVCGKASYLETIWVEPEYLRLEGPR
jgi:hypothetical protein